MPTVESSNQSAMAHLQAGRIQQAVDILHKIAAEHTNEPRCRFMLGFIAHRAGNLPLALDWLNKSISIDPKIPEPYFLQGIILQQQNRLSEAIDVYRKFLGMRPMDGKALNNLGRAMLDNGQITQATAMLRQAAAAKPPNAGAWSNLGDALRKQGDLSGAIEHYHKAIAIDPNCAEAHGNLGIALSKLGKSVESIASLQRAIAINPQAYNPRYNLARVFQDSHRLDEAFEQCKIAVDLRPTSADALNLLGNLFGITGQIPECIACQRRAIVAKPDFASGHSNLLLTLQYLPDTTSEELFAAHLQWAAQHTAHLKKDAPAYPTNRDPNRRLRIGYLSPNFNNHSVAYFFEPVLAAHDRTKVEIFCYSDIGKGDATTQRLRMLSEHWREIAGKSDDDVIAMIRNDEIDILVDLAGHTAGNRLPLFARKPAPVQITWLGYPATTGLREMDYRLTDDICDPPGISDTLHTETLLRIEGGCWAYQPPASPPIGRVPAISNGFVTFGSFNNQPKITPKVIETWARILNRVPGSRMILKSAGLCSKMGRDYVLNHFAPFNIGPDRVELVSWAHTTEAHLQLYNRVDIALDTFPYNGTTTTCEALWMGVPVVTCLGSTHVSRVGAALLTRAGYPQWIAKDISGYIELAVQLAGKLQTMTRLRETLRDRIHQSPLFDATRLARQLENLYQHNSKKNVR